MSELSGDSQLGHPPSPVQLAGFWLTGLPRFAYRAALFSFGSLRYIAGMLWRLRSRGRPLNAPAAFIHPCQPIVAKQPPTGPGWAHELKHDGYRLQIHIRDGRVRLYTMNGADWSKRYPLIGAEAARLKNSVLDERYVRFGHQQTFGRAAVYLRPVGRAEA